MFGFKYFKFQPSEYVLLYRGGKVIKEGAGLSFLCFTPSAAIAVLPINSMDAPFIFQEMTLDFQSISLQGQLVYRIVSPARQKGYLVV